MTTKVNKTEPYEDCKVDTIVCKGKLVLIPYKSGEGINKDYIILVDDNYIKPIIISETEEIEVGDKWYDGHGNIFTIETEFQKNLALVKNKGEERLYIKVLALLENFSPKHLQAIVDRKLNDGDEVFVECEEPIINWIDNQMKPYFEIVLNKDNHITLFPVKKWSKTEIPREESWDDIQTNLGLKFNGKEDKFVNWGQIRFLIDYLKENYNPPIRK